MHPSTYAAFFDEMEKLALSEETMKSYATKRHTTPEIARKGVAVAGEGRRKGRAWERPKTVPFDDPDFLDANQWVADRATRASGKIADRAREGRFHHGFSEFADRASKKGGSGLGTAAALGGAALTAGAIGAGVHHLIKKHKEKTSGAGHAAVDIAGLGILAAPTLAKMRGKPMKDKTKDRTELAGLGTLAAGVAHDHRQDFANAAKSGWGKLRGVGGQVVKHASVLEKIAKLSRAAQLHGMQAASKNLPPAPSEHAPAAPRLSAAEQMQRHSDLRPGAVAPTGPVHSGLELAKRRAQGTAKAVGTAAAPKGGLLSGLMGRAARAFH